ncbi:unnamed protein product [Adineta steineri]|uniref:Uncharacterized protein n=1 Tax=Adineta steineri TaxID=433720 RepID=A0A814KLC1_9BILA|nr:unnamed protein product [Adineta steineri]CAF1344098.1 unnamed protein product [Adineta steineri]
MNSITIFTGVLSCLLFMLAITHSFALAGQTADEQQHHLLIEQPSVILPKRYFSFYHNDDDASNDDSEVHEFEKRRFNAWAGKRSTFGKRRFNAWAGRR